MPFLTEQEKTELRSAIRYTESRTQAEIVTVIARQSDGYRYIPLLWAALISLSLPGLFYAYDVLSSSGWTNPGNAAGLSRWIYSAQVLSFLGIGMLLQIAGLRMLFIPENIKHERAARHAREQFFLQNLHKTKGRTGVLIFVSVAEHYVEIIVDEAISEAIDDSLWEQTINDFVSHVQRGDIATGFSGTLTTCREILWEHFPAPEGCPDELPNHLIEV